MCRTGCGTVAVVGLRSGFLVKFFQLSSYNFKETFKDGVNVCVVLPCFLGFRVSKRSKEAGELAIIRENS